VAHGTIGPPTGLSLPKRLHILHDAVHALVEEYQPDEAAVEETFSNVNAKSTILLGHARGVVIVPPARAGIPVAEYAAKVVKKAIVGTGGADKSQVAFMIRRILPGADLRSGDAADALAVAITHAHHRTSAVG
jgi:crossover junction endodeoxyribonuclease RuvC